MLLRYLQSCIIFGDCNDAWPPSEYTLKNKVKELFCFYEDLEREIILFLSKFDFVVFLHVIKKT